MRDKVGEKLDLAEYNSLGRDDASERDLVGESHIEQLKAEIRQYVAQAEQSSYRLSDKYFGTKVTEEAAKAVFAAFPSIDFGEWKKHLNETDAAYLTEEKYTLIIPTLIKLGEIRVQGTTKKLFRAEYVELKRMLLDALLDFFSSPLQIPTFEWTIDQLKELEMIPPHFSYLEMEQYCALGRWR
jgi:hypothetical protein